MRIGTRLKNWARAIKKDVVALYIAARDPRVPWHVKLAAAAIAAYALSPIDLIPDFIPVLGYLDDVIIVPLGILLVLRMIPDALMAEFREEAQRLSERPVGRAAAVAIIGVWVAATALTLWAFWPAPAP
ncbi:YkvA family protein [Microvirga sp. M2]|uniref:YkvA family protein n=1 Tax=Microvirga sp. M2 TaxID=3073270 RepID=UPI0039C055D7